MNSIQNILSNATIKNNCLYLNCGDIEKKLYAQVNNILERLFGKWNKSKKCHCFAFDPSDLIKNYLTHQKLPPKNELAYFPTPKIILNDIKEDIDYNGKYLEPSAGQGAIANAILEKHPDAHVDCIEYSELNYNILKEKGFNVKNEDFLTVTPDPIYDYVIMNPPFSVAGDKTAYITHVEHAMKFLNKLGYLYCIVPTFTHKEDKKTAKFKDFIAKHFCRQIKYEKGTFRDSGTMIETTMFCLTKKEKTAAYFIDRFYWAIIGHYGSKIARENKKDLSDKKYIDFVIDYCWKEQDGDFLNSQYKNQYLQTLKEYDQEHNIEEPETKSKPKTRSKPIKIEPITEYVQMSLF